MTMCDSLRFSVYKHSLIVKDGRIITRNFIVLKDIDKGVIIKFTNLHKYVKGGKGRLAKSITENGNKRHYYVIKFLNYVFFDSGWNIQRLTEISIDMVSDFLNAYAMGELCENDNTRTPSTINKCIMTIIDFLDSLASDVKCCFKPADLYKYEEYRTKKGKIQKRKVPVFDIRYIDKEVQIMRDIPEKVFAILMDQIRRQHTDILMTASLSAFGGLRPSETLNVRRRDSILGPGIKFSIFDDEVTEIRIDLTKELNLRSDLVVVGGIKKERNAKIYPAFLKLFYDFYHEYMQYMEGRQYETEYGPLSINNTGKAMCYRDYYNRFRAAVTEIIPTCLASDDPEVVQYGMLLQEHSLAPHALRHWFSVKLVLFGEDLASLMYYRGDKSPESSLRYIQNKSDLEKQYMKMNNELFDYRTWQAEKYYKGK